MPGKKHTKTEYEKHRDMYRKACPRHVVRFEADLDEDGKRHVFSMANDARIAGNRVTGELRRRIGQMRRTKEYRLLKKDYAWHSEHMKGLDKEGDRYKRLDAERAETAKKMTALQERYGITWKDTRELMEESAKAEALHSVFALARAEDIWHGVEKVLYSDGKDLHFKKRGDLPVLRAKQVERGIAVRLDPETGDLVFSVEGVGVFGVLPVCGDRFLEEEYAAITAFLAKPETEEDAVLLMKKTGEIVPVFRPCYAALVCEEIRGRLSVFIHLTIASDPMPKKDKDGNLRHKKGKGRVGVDLGTQSAAIAENTYVDLFNLAERNGKSTKAYERRKAFLRREMDASKRKTNPERFNKDGTYKKGSRGKWKYSRRYLRLRVELKELERRNALSRRYAVQEAVNSLREMADVCIIEPKNAKKLARRKKKTELSDKTITVQKKDGTVKTFRKGKKKKRFGKSVHHRCPGLFQAELKKKFGSGYHEVPNNYRASQYDHTADDYKKIKLSDRMRTLSDGTVVQRDSYSSFLLLCADDAFEKIDRWKCLKQFPSFKSSHDEMVERIRSSGKTVCNSGIKPEKTRPRGYKHHDRIESKNIKQNAKTHTGTTHKAKPETESSTARGPAA